MSHFRLGFIEMIASKCDQVRHCTQIDANFNTKFNHFICICLRNCVRFTRLFPPIGMCNACRPYDNEFNFFNSFFFILFQWAQKKNHKPTLNSTGNLFISLRWGNDSTNPVPSMPHNFVVVVFAFIFLADADKQFTQYGVIIRQFFIQHFSIHLIDGEWPLSCKYSTYFFAVNEWWICKWRDAFSHLRSETVQFWVLNFHGKTLFRPRDSFFSFLSNSLAKSRFFFSYSRRLFLEAQFEVQSRTLLIKRFRLKLWHPIIRFSIHFRQRIQMNTARRHFVWSVWEKLMSALN